jgi:hypothetical protein
LPGSGGLYGGAGGGTPADPIGNGGNGAQGAIIILYTTKTNRFLSMF